VAATARRRRFNAEGGKSTTEGANRKKNWGMAVDELKHQLQVGN